MDNKVSVIVFSKGRPMQLHAYLESLLKFSDAEADNITVLCCETKGIRYGKVRERFPGVKWQTEQNFENDLKRAVADAGEYIMFGCDDVVFTRKFSLDSAAGYLRANPDVFGFSVRLGENIMPFPENAVCNDGIMEWDWEQSRERHFNYPWELDCTLYRKDDVAGLIGQEEKTIKNPNYLEAIVNEDNKSRLISRKHMAEDKAHSSAIVITVNRVQDSYQNGFDDSMLTDIYSLDKQYNDEDNSLDIDKIAELENDQVHVGAEYFILRKADKGYSAQRLRRKKYKNIEKKIKAFTRKCYNYIERRVYRSGGFEKKLSIENTRRTLDILRNNDVSFIRIGGDEISIMQGRSTPAQQYDEKLDRRLREILKINDKKLKVAVPYYYIYPQKNLNPYIEVLSMSIADKRRFLMKHCVKDITYLDSCVTQAYHIYQEYDFEGYYKDAAKLFAGRDITVICGYGIFDKLQNKLLDVCASVEYQYVPVTEAYSEYDEILKKALTIDKSRLICLSAGSTAKPLACDLYKNGYKVWDIGHLLKDYDLYKRKTERTRNEIIRFYMPD